MTVHAFSKHCLITSTGKHFHLVSLVNYVMQWRLNETAKLYMAVWSMYLLW